MDSSAVSTRELFRREFSANREAALVGLNGGSIGHMELYLRERTADEIRELIARFSKAGPHVATIAENVGQDDSMEALREIFWSMILEDFMENGQDSHGYMERQWLPAYGPDEVKAKIVPDRGRFRRAVGDDDDDDDWD